MGCYLGFCYYCVYLLNVMFIVVFFMGFLLDYVVSVKSIGKGVIFVLMIGEI